MQFAHSRLELFREVKSYQKPRNITVQSDKPFPIKTNEFFLPPAFCRLFKECTPTTCFMAKGEDMQAISVGSPHAIHLRV